MQSSTSTHGRAKHSRAARATRGNRVAGDSQAAVLNAHAAVKTTVAVPDACLGAVEDASKDGPVAILA
eukprot:4280361-Pyramimonas_sp.AAC.1